MQTSRRYFLQTSLSALLGTTLLGLGLSTCQAQTSPPPRDVYAQAGDRQLRETMAARERDWRIGPISYQVLVDRFAPSSQLDAKRHLYPAPKQLRRWDEVPKQGRYLEAEQLWSHEIDFWGGDFSSLTGKLDYILNLGADVLYLNPIHLAYTNHKYDAQDYQQVSPEYGTRDDVKRLAQTLHSRGMKLVLDGVFNHMGRSAPRFQQALKDPSSHYRSWYDFNPAYPGGARGWWGVPNLPELNLEHPAVREHLWGGPQSVVRSYLRDGVDGWRLDVAFDIGFNYLAELTAAAHAEKPGSLVLGEIANYPKDWIPAVDGVLGFTLRQLMLGLVKGDLSAARGMAMVDRLITDTGIEPMLRSWIYLDNHDTPRLAHVLPDLAQRRQALLLQFTLPGAPNLYFGTELGMSGGEDPEMRAPMRWDWVRDDNPMLQFTRQMVQLRREHRALRIGNHRTLQSDKLIAFQRYTDRAAESVLVLINPSDQHVKETLLVPDSKMMDGSRHRDRLGGPDRWVSSALLHMDLPPRGMAVLTIDTSLRDGYSNYKRVH